MIVCDINNSVLYSGVFSYPMGCHIDRLWLLQDHTVLLMLGSTRSQACTVTPGWAVKLSELPPGTRRTWRSWQKMNCETGARRTGMSWNERRRKVEDVRKQACCSVFHQVWNCLLTSRTSWKPTFTFYNTETIGLALWLAVSTIVVYKWSWLLFNSSLYSSIDIL